MRVFLAKRLDGALMPACEESERQARRMVPGEVGEFDWKSRNTRSVQWHKRYFALCNMVYANVEGINIQGQWIDFSSVDVVHLTLKGLAGLHDALIVLPDGSKALLIRSIAFDKMTADEWARAWPRLLDAVHQHVLPMVTIAAVENEIARLAA